MSPDDQDGLAVFAVLTADLPAQDRQAILDDFAAFKQARPDTHLSIIEFAAERLTAMRPHQRVPPEETPDELRTLITGDDPENRQ